MTLLEARWVSSCKSYPLASALAGTAAALYFISGTRGCKLHAQTYFDMCGWWARLVQGLLQYLPPLRTFQTSRVPLEHAAADLEHKAVPASLPLARLLVLDVCSKPIAECLSFTDAWRSRSVAHAMQPVVMARVALAKKTSITSEDIFSRLKKGQLLADSLDVMESVLAQPEMLKERDCAGRTLLIKAVQDGSPELVRALLAARSDPNAGGGHGWTALHVAAVGTCATMCELLLDHKADVHRHSADGCPALFYAQRNGDSEVLRLLLFRSAGIQARGCARWEPTGADGWLPSADHTDT